MGDRLSQVRFHDHIDKNFRYQITPKKGEKNEK